MESIDIPDISDTPVTTTPDLRENIDPRVWGPYAWKFLESLVCSLPPSPSDNSESLPSYSTSDVDLISTLTNFFEHDLGILLPCEKCRSHYANFIVSHPVTDSMVSRQRGLEWIYTYQKSVASLKEQVENVDTPVFPSFEEYKEKVLSLFLPEEEDMEQNTSDTSDTSDISPPPPEVSPSSPPQEASPQETNSEKATVTEAHEAHQTPVAETPAPLVEALLSSPVPAPAPAPAPLILVKTLGTHQRSMQVTSNSPMIPNAGIPSGHVSNGRVNQAMNVRLPGTTTPSPPSTITTTTVSSSGLPSRGTATSVTGLQSRMMAGAGRSRGRCNCRR